MIMPDEPRTPLPPLPPQTPHKTSLLDHPYPASSVRSGRSVRHVGHVNNDDAGQLDLYNNVGQTGQTGQFDQTGPTGPTGQIDPNDIVIQVGRPNAMDPTGQAKPPGYSFWSLPKNIDIKKLVMAVCIVVLAIVVVVLLVYFLVIYKPVATIDCQDLDLPSYCTARSTGQAASGQAGQCSISCTLPAPVGACSAPAFNPADSTTWVSVQPDKKVCDSTNFVGGTGYLCANYTLTEASTSSPSTPIYQSFDRAFTLQDIATAFQHMSQHDQAVQSGEDWYGFHNVCQKEDCVGVNIRSDQNNTIYFVPCIRTTGSQVANQQNQPSVVLPGLTNYGVVMAVK